MPGSNDDGSPPERLQETRDELTQASIALNTAYDRLQDLRASLRSFTAQRDRLSGIRRSQQQARAQIDELMGPEHSAIILSDSEEDSEIDEPLRESLRESLPSQFLEVTSRWNNQRARLNAAIRQAVPPESGHSSSPHSSAVSSDELRFVYPPSSRRRRPLPPAAPSSRDAGVLSPPNPSPARRSILEAHMRQLRRASSPSESSTTLGRRVTQRAAAAAQATISERQVAGTRTLNPTNNIIRSTLPLGLEPRPPHPPRSLVVANPHPIESRAATHLRHSLLPNPPSGIRLGSPRTVSTNSSHIRLSDRLELRPRARGSSPVSTMVHDSYLSDIPTRNPFVGHITASYQAFFEDHPRFNFGDPLLANSRVRRHVNTQGQEQINRSEHMSERDRSGDLSDPAAWMRPPGGLVLGTGPRPPGAQPEPDTDDTIHDPPPAHSRDARPVGQVAGVRRRRGWGMSPFSKNPNQADSF